MRKVTWLGVEVGTGGDAASAMTTSPAGGLAMSSCRRITSSWVAEYRLLTVLMSAGSQTRAIMNVEKLVCEAL